MSHTFPLLITANYRGSVVTSFFTSINITTWIKTDLISWLCDSRIDESQCVCLLSKLYAQHGQVTQLCYTMRSLKNFPPQRCDISFTNLYLNRYCNSLQHSGSMTFFWMALVQSQVFRGHINDPSRGSVCEDTDGELWMRSFSLRRRVSGEIREKKRRETAPSVSLRSVSRGLFNWGN